MIPRMYSTEDFAVHFYYQTLGVTEPALKVLRNELATRVREQLIVYELPSRENDECEGYGFIIHSLDTKTCVIIGDGFRGDGQGTGGAGHRAAQVLLALFHLTPIALLPEEGVQFRDDIACYWAALRLVVSLALPTKPPFEYTPNYIDHILRR